VIAVTHQRIKSFVATCELFKKESQRVIKVLSFKEAQRWLDEHMQPKDTILIANDLPDILEARPNI
ncbi:MAG: hypothetical protein CMF41_01060, partial [Legionellales bacterium]|nr:hypothetical protein [Legionellales bacterium]